MARKNLLMTLNTESFSDLQAHRSNGEHRNLAKNHEMSTSRIESASDAIHYNGRKIRYQHE